MEFEIELTHIEDCFSDIIKMVESHYKEISFFSDFAYKFNPDIEQYKALEKHNLLFIFCAYDVDGSIIGYNIYTVSNHPHCKNQKVAIQDLFFVKPEFRKQGIGLGLIKEAEEYFGHIGVNFIIQAASVKKDFSSLLLNRGYKLLDILYIKEL